MSVDKVSRAVRWTAAGAIAVALAVWLVAVAFALAGFRRIAEGTNQLLLWLMPIVLVLVVLAAIAWLAALLTDWQARKK